MKIKSIKIENFRCFRGSHQFNIEGDTIILYGENGYGKSSFFDAIEWCLTGNIERFNKNSEKSFDKSIIINREASNGETCSIELGIGEIKLIRFFNIVEKPRESVIIKNLLTNITLASGKSNVEKYIREEIVLKTANKKSFNILMKKSHILSQDQITDFVIRDNPKERFNSLADIMGYRQIINLLNNLRLIKETLNKEVKRQEENIKTHKEILEAKNQELEDIKYNQILDSLKEISFEKNLDVNSLNQEFLNLESRIVKEKASLDLKLTQLDLVSKKFLNYTPSNLKERAIVLNTEVKNNLNRIKRAEILINRILNEKNKISIDELDLDQRKTLISEHEDINNEFLILEKALDKINLTKPEIEELIVEEESKKQKLFYTNTYYFEYRESQKIVELNPSLIFKENEKSLKSNNRINRYNKYLKVFEDYLNEDNEVTSLNKLNNSIQDIYKYLLENNKEGLCPVCSTDKGNNLTNSIYENIKFNLQEIAYKSSKITKVNEIINRIRVKVSSATIERAEAEKNKKELELKYNIALKNIKDIQNNTLFSSGMFNYKNNEIEDILKGVSEKINIYKKYKVDYYNLETLRNKLNDFPIKDLESYKIKFNKIKSRVLTLDKRINFLENVVKIQNEALIYKKSELDELEKNIFLISKLLTIDEEDMKLTVIIDLEKQKKESLNLKNQKLEEVASLYKRYLINNENISKISSYVADIEKKENQYNFYQRELNKLNEYRKTIFSEIGNEAAELLNKPSSSIQKYFNYLNPVPSINKIKFKSPSPEELEIVLDYNHNQEKIFNQNNVQYSLSSGQLYVLAISIFLAINEAQNISKLDFIGIDDPIQNMDDVNQFSVCDVLSSINKQLIFSTHDFEFLKLYLKKNEYKKNLVQVFILEQNETSSLKVKELKF